MDITHTDLLSLPCKSPLFAPGVKSGSSYLFLVMGWMRVSNHCTVCKSPATEFHLLQVLDAIANQV